MNTIILNITWYWTSFWNNRTWCI